jgi:hypothetical protein
MVIVYSAATALMLALIDPRRSFIPAWVALLWAYFRIVDVGTQKLMEVLVHSLRPAQQSSIQRTLLLSALNVYEIVAAYAIIYLLSGGVQQDTQPLASATSAFYFSTMTALTVGYGDFVPKTDATRRLAVSQVVVVALFIVAWFPVAVSLLFPRDAGPPTSHDPRTNER